tara:strand:+ start:556 stop:1083 length:528 start_codon:yes stop_codon:yes gene_type:complete
MTVYAILIKMRIKSIQIFFLLFLSNSLVVANENIAKIEIDNPKFSEIGLDDKIYEIKAKKGLKSEDELELFTIEGKFKSNKEGKWIYLEAEKGNYLQTSSSISLEENIKFYTDDGEIVRSSQAIFDMDKDIIKLSENVRHKSIDGLVKADNSVITNNFNHITYHGNVITILIFED